jgi:serine/threonine protein kinase
MPSARRQEIEALFEAALDRPRDARTQWLAGACAGDAELLAEVAALLAAHERTAGLLEAPLPAGPVVPSELGRNERIGPYRIVRTLGRGGMGLVFLAERADGQYRQQVAIKVILGGADALELQQRFQRERQILAALTHPNIARLLDGGLTEGGRPYLVMEYVEGEPIDAYCDRRHLGIDQRLRLFTAVARAVHHAHRSLVVHRDLKPSNILVTPDGQPKLLDFGIAKLLDPASLGVTAPQTRSELRLMTPEYASPEQIRGQPVTTAADVYALGVILYELLAGRRPFRFDGLAPGEAERIVLEADPPRPSTAFQAVRAATDPAIAQAARARADGPDRLAKRLRGDLDRIALMALRKEPDRRYASAEQMAEDVFRHLDGEPVLAHTDSRLYRMGKFVSRHRGETVAAALALLALVAGAVIAASQATLARRERDRAEAALVRAEDALDRSEAVTSFLIGLFEANSPDEARGDTITAGELLRRGQQRVTALAGQPIAQAAMLGAVGRVHESLGRYDDALDLYHRASALLRGEYGEEHADVATLLKDIGSVRRRLGAYVEADSLYRRALAIEERLLGDGNPTVAATLFALARVSTDRGELETGEAFYRRSLGIRRAVLGEMHPLTPTTMIAVAAVRRRLGDYDAAESLLREALDLRRRIFAGDHPDIAESMLRLASLLMENRGRLDEAETLFRDALAMQRRVLGDRHAGLVPAMHNLGSLLDQRGDHAAAEPFYRESLALRTAVLGPDHPLTGESQGHLAQHLFRTDRLDAAEAMFRASAATFARAVGPDHPTVAGSLFGVAEVRLQRGDLAGAERIMRDVLSIRERAFGPDQTLVGTTLARLAEIRRRAGDPAEAETLLRRAHAILLDRYGPAHRETEAVAAALRALPGPPSS